MVYPKKKLENSAIFFKKKAQMWMVPLQIKFLTLPSICADNWDIVHLHQVVQLAPVKQDTGLKLVLIEDLLDFTTESLMQWIGDM